MASKSLTSFNETNSLEYGPLKILYEVLNKRFRLTQAQLNAINFRFGNGFATFQQKVERASSNGELLSPNALNDIKILWERINKFGSEFAKCTDMDVSTAKDLNDYVELLKEAYSNDPLVHEHFRKQRIDRMIVNQLLRTGYFETAQKLAEYGSLEITTQKNIFHVAKQVEQSLMQHDLSECLKWVLENASRLHRTRSCFETEVRIQQCVELVRAGRCKEALTYVRAHFGNTSRGVCKCCNMVTRADWTGSRSSPTLLHLMGLIAFGPNSTRKEHHDLLSNNRYELLIDMFHKENARIHQIPAQSPFSACLQAGIAVHKTPNCKSDPESRCIVCKDVFPLAEGLPVTHFPTSRLFCIISNEPFDEDENRPMMLPNGRVYGEKSISLIARNNEFMCPRTNEVYNLSDLKRIFVF